MHYYKRNIGDYAKKAGKLSMLQHGAYTLLIDACYDRERFPTLEDAMEWAWAESEAEQQAVQVVLRRFFTLKESLYVQDRITEELEAYRALSEVNSRIAKQREETKRARSVLKREPIDHESAPNHEPLTTNQEPLKVPKGTSPVNRTPSQQLLELFHEKAKLLPRVTVFNEPRRKVLQARYREVMAEEKWTAEQTIDWFGTFYGIVNDSAFLTGRSQPGRDGRVFKADWDWIHGPKNFVKIVEGKYSGD